MSLKTFDQLDWITPEAEEFADYWRSLPRDGGVPNRSAFDPTKIVRLLPGIAMYEVQSGEEVISRLAGTELVEFFGQEITGKNLLDLWPDEFRDEASRSVTMMVTQPCGIIVILAGRTRSGKIARSAAVGFPLLDHDDICNRLIFFSSGFVEAEVRITREDQILSLSVERSTYIDISS
ncbi:MAG: hypothetical protein COB93_06290 [Sneathiella sp.]|nr:MAG: hypothetical protein COB93_06290 [Sneathiella sp.]